MKVTTIVRGTAIGIDLGNRKSQVCVREDGKIVEQFKFSTDREGLKRAFKGRPHCSILMEACTVSHWVGRELRALGFHVIVIDPSRIPKEIRGRRKSDKIDARLLALICERGPEFYHEVEPRSFSTMLGLTVLRSRDLLVRQRTSLICAVRQCCASHGVRLKASPDSFAERASPQIPEEVFPHLEPLLRTIHQLTQSIRDYDAQLARKARDEYPQTALLRQVHGVGVVTSLAFVLHLEDPKRFAKSRQAGPFLGLIPNLHGSGDGDPQLRITRAGNPLIRKLMVQCAHILLRDNAPDTDLKRFGEAIARRGGKNAKKRAVVAVARKLSVLLLALWKTGEVYEPLRNSEVAAESVAA